MSLLKKFAQAEIIWGEPNNYFLEDLKEREFRSCTNLESRDSTRDGNMIFWHIDNVVTLKVNPDCKGRSFSP